MTSHGDDPLIPAKLSTGGGLPPNEKWAFFGSARGSETVEPAHGLAVRATDPANYFENRSGPGNSVQNIAVLDGQRSRGRPVMEKLSGIEPVACG